MGTVLLASALPVVGAVLVIVEHPRPVTASSVAPELLPGGLHLDVRTLSGKISHRHGKFVFQEGPQGTIYNLDDQQQAKLFYGKSVQMTVTVDPHTNIVHVHKIGLM